MIQFGPPASDKWPQLVGRRSIGSAAGPGPPSSRAGGADRHPNHPAGPQSIANSAPSRWASQAGQTGSPGSKIERQIDE